MRIGLDIRNIGRKRTGDEVVFLNLIREFARVDSENEYELLLDLRSQEDLSSISSRLDIIGKRNFRLVTLPAKTRFDWNGWYVPKYLLAHSLDIYHTQYIAPLFVPRKTALVTHVHDVSFRAEPQYISFVDRFFLDTLIPRSLRLSRLIVAPSVFTKKEIIRWYGVPENKILVAWNAVSPEFSRKNSNGEERAAVCKKYGVSAPFVLSVGTLQPRKNLPYLIEAFSCVHNEDPMLKLVIVGNRVGHHIDRGIDETIRRFHLESAVIFPGFVEQSDLPVLMSTARVFVFPSRYEGFGIPLLEAMSQGVPVVAADIPALREAGSHAAIFAPLDNVRAFSSAIRLAIHQTDERERMIKDGYIRSEYFSWEKSARDILAAYSEICFHKEAIQ